MVATLCLVSTVVSCGSEVVNELEPATEDGEELVWYEGTEFRKCTDCGAPVAAGDRPELAALKARIEDPNEPPLAAGEFVRAMTEEELAEGLRPILLSRGTVYRGTQPERAMAARLKEAAAARELLHRVTVAGRLPDGSEAPPDVGQDKGYLFIGNGEPSAIYTDAFDNRTEPGTGYPVDTFVLLHDKGCSAVLIGWDTAITAAHCVWSLEYGTPNWPDGKMKFRPGARGSGGVRDGSGNLIGCDVKSEAATILPTAYTTTGDPFYDFAVIDLSGCSDNPSQYVGWSGFSVNGGTSGDGYSYNMYGYPARVSDGGEKPCPARPNSSRFPCGMYGRGYWNDWRVESDQIDATKGQSGGPWRWGEFVIGTHKGERPYFDIARCFGMCYRNYGRRLDDTFWSFVQAYASEY